jgi:large subunit ribosomal protein L15
MTINKKKKVVRYRGSKTHGSGSMKKRRGAGHRGGRGAAGSGKRADTKKPSVWKGKYFGKHGFKSKSRIPMRTINIGYLDENAHKLDQNLQGDDLSVNLKKLGFDKLLGSGKVSKKFRINVQYASKRAVEKVKKSGGEVTISAGANE